MTRAAPAPPPLLLAAALGFWGWQTGLWPPALAMAVLLEVAPLVRFRWDFSPAEFNRAADLCALVFVGMAAYLLFAGRTVFVVFTLLKWLPMSLFPLVFCQFYSTRDDVDLRAVSLFVRGRRAPRPDARPARLDLAYPYFGLCLVAAAFANQRNGWFFPAFLLLAGWALWPPRSRRYSLVVWSLFLVTAAAGGYAGHQGLHRLQQVLELKGMELFAHLRGEETDPFESITGIGDIRDRKPSGRLLLRVVPGPEPRGPFLLREASYNRYHAGRWFALNSPFSPVPPEPPGDRFTWGPGQGRARRLRVWTSLERRGGMLKLPTGTHALDDLPVGGLERNDLGAVRVRQGPGLLGYTAAWTSATPLDAPPEAADLAIPPEEAPAIRALADRLDLRGRPPRDAGRRINRHFFSEFRYSLDARPRRDPTPLAGFLRETRAGHCEHFATAGVLLLRSAGIPARYAVGYSAHEYSAAEKALVVRDRHAHAWALYWDGARWRDLDPTPPDWRPLEAEAASPLERLTDRVSWLRFRIAKWRWRPGGGKPPIETLWLILPLGLFLLRRLARKRRIRREGAAPPAEAGPPPAGPPGADSPVYEIERRLSAIGLRRSPGEPLARWRERTTEFSTENGFPEIPAELVRLHYRYRFAPDGLSRESRRRLEAGVREWLAAAAEPAGPIDNRDRV